MKVLFVEAHDLDYADPLGSHQYIRRFREAGDRCFWLGPAISPLHLFKLDRANRKRFRIWFKGIREFQDISWLVPLTLMPYYRIPIFGTVYAGRNHYRFCIPPVRQLLKKAGFSEVDLIWCANPAAIGLLDLLPHRRSCFRLADRLDQFGRVPQSILALQDELIRRVDAVLATSRELYEYAVQIKGEGVHYLPNGVSEYFFEQTGPPPPDFPPAEKVVVFVGTLDSWFDCESLEYALEQLPECHFLIIGTIKDNNVREKIYSLDHYDNFTYLGRRAHSQIPLYLRHCSAGMIPFKLTALTHAINPIKYYEYLACGLPVVASPMRELLALQGPLYTYRDPVGFCRVLEKAMEEKPAVSSRLVDYARNHTWERRFQSVKQILNEGRDGLKK